jgi:hypothetical protein
MKKERPTSNVQHPTLNDRAKFAIAPSFEGEKFPGTSFSTKCDLLRQHSAEAFLLSRLAEEKGEKILGGRLSRFARAMGKSARLIEDLAKEQLKRSRQLQQKKNPSHPRNPRSKK